MAGYTRQSAAQIVSGEVISAAPINAELNQILAAFNNSTGHSHDGTSAEGPPIDRIADADQNKLNLLQRILNQMQLKLECFTLHQLLICFLIFELIFYLLILHRPLLS